ncbi:MAG: hypothetical protein AABZ76_07405 [Pseudomonadota bacterium]
MSRNFGFTVDLTGVETGILDYVKDTIEEKLTDTFVDLTGPPPEGTPVDTRTASNGWQMDLADPMAPALVNHIPYINRLDDGSSSQSPAGFVGRAIDKNWR